MKHVLLLLIVLTGCTPPAHPTPVAHDACVVACRRLAALGCDEGSSPCVPVMRHLDEYGAIQLEQGGHMTCVALAAARTVLDVRDEGLACGEVDE